MNPEPIDPSLYVRPPVMNLEGGIGLCRALVHACPKNAPGPVKKGAKKLAAAADKAQSALAKRQAALGQIPDEDSRLIDQEGDGSWGALRGRLTSYSLLRASEYPDAARAGQLITLLFGDAGLSFLKESYPVQWSTADTILQRIHEDPQLKADINRIAGSEFLEHIQKRHLEYGAMVKRLLTKGSGDSVNLGAEVRALGRSIVAYATQVCASADDDDDNPGLIAMAREALRPLDLFREVSAKRASPAPEVEVSAAGASAETSEVK